MASKKPPKPSRMEQNRTPARDRPASAVLKSVRDAMERTQLGLRDLQGQDRERKEHGLRDVIMNGRTVTWPMQVLGDGPLTAGQTAWYLEQVRARVSSDPVAQFFVRLRNDVEKEGVLEVSTRNSGVYIRSLSSEDPTIRRNTPYGTRSVAINNDGEVVYLCSRGEEISRLRNHPELFAIADRYFDEAPDDLQRQPVEALAKQYVNLLQQIVDDAHAEFGHLP